MTFSETIERDLGTYLNIEEFGEVVNVGGVNVEAVVLRSSSSSATEYTPHKNITPNLHGVKVEGKFLTVYVREKSLGRKPRNGEMLTVGGVRYKVNGVTTAQGLLKIEVSGDLDRVLPPKY